MKTKTAISVSPSSLDRVDLCGASAIEAANIPSVSTAVQERGTDMHAVLALALVDSDQAAQEMFPGRDVTNPLAAKGQLNILWGGKQPLDLLVERKHDLTFLGMIATGRSNEWQSDAEWTEGSKGHVADYKSGTTDYGDVNLSKQFRSYLAAKVASENLEGGYVHLVQPAKFATVQSSRFFTAEELKEWAKDTHNYLEDIRTGHTVATKYNPSPKACQWCVAKKTCEAVQGQVQERKDARDDVRAEAMILGGAGGEGQPIEFRHGLPELILALDAQTVFNAQDLEARCLAITEVTAENADEVGKLLQLVTKTETVVEERRTVGKKPILDLGKAWDQVFKDAGVPLGRGKAHAKGLLMVWMEKQAKLAADARAKAEAEAQAHAKAVEAAAKKGKVAPPPPPPPAPVATPKAVAGVKTKTVTKYQLLDETKVPKQFLRTVVNEPLVVAAVKDGQIKVGDHKWIRVWTEEQVSSK